MDASEGTTEANCSTPFYREERAMSEHTPTVQPVNPGAHSSPDARTQQPPKDHPPVQQANPDAGSDRKSRLKELAKKIRGCHGKVEYQIRASLISAKEAGE